jgi:hypothetical protein
MSFQITVLKVLAGHPGGSASLGDLRRAVGILISSGPDWTDRTNRLAARAPDLDIFSQAFVLRDNAGWQITDAGRAFLTSVETPLPIVAGDGQAPEAIVPLTPVLTSPMPLWLIGLQTGTCACRKSNPNILVVQPAQDRAAKNGPGQFDGARDRRILLQR